MRTDVPIRILVVDDHPVDRQGIAALVSGQSGMALMVAMQTFGLRN